MKKFFKFLSYSLVYLLISLGSAYGVITLSVNFSNRNNSGDDSNAGVVVPAEIQSIVTNITFSEAVSTSLGVKIETESDIITITPDVTISLPQDDKTFEAEGSINLVMQKKTAQDKQTSEVVSLNTSNVYSVESNNTATSINIDFAYKNDNLYLEVLNNKFVISTSSMMSSLSEVMSLLGVDIDSMLGGIDLANMDINTILSMFSNFEKTETKDSVILDIQIPAVGGIIHVECDKNYKLNALSVSGLSLEGISITASGEVGYPTNVVIENRNNEEFVNVTTVLHSATTLIRYFKNPDFGFNIDLNANNNSLSAKIDASIEDKKAKVETSVLGVDAQVILKDNTLYAELGNIYAKFGFSDVSLVKPLLDELNVNISDEVLTILDAVSSGNYSSLTSLISTKDFNIQDIDLSILENVEVKDNATIITLKNIGKITISENEEGELASLSFNGFNVTVNLIARKYQDFTLASSQENYIDIASILPTATTLVKFVSNTTFYGSMEVKYNESIFPISFEVDVSNGIYVHAQTSIYEKDIDVIFENNVIYVSLMGNKIKAKIEDIDEIKTLIEDTFDIDLSNTDINLDDLTDKIKEILNPEINPLLIKSFIVNDGKIEAVAFNDLTLSFSSNENNIVLSGNYKNISVSADVFAGEEITKPEIKDEEFSDAKDFVLTIQNVLNYVKNEQYFIGFSVKVKDIIEVDGALNYTPNGLNLTAHTIYNNLQAKVTLTDGKLYIEAEQINLEFDIDDYNEVVSFVSNKLGIDIESYISSFEESTGLTVEDLVKFIKGEKSINDLISSANININSPANTDSIDIEKLLQTIDIVLNSSLIKVSSDEFNVEVVLNNDMIESINASYKDIISGSLTLENKPFDFVPQEEYLNVSEIISYANKVIDYANTKKIDINAVVTNKTKNSSINGKVQVDLENELKLSAIVSSQSQNNMNISVFIENGMLYFDYNGLGLKINNDNFKELVYIIAEVMGIDATKIPFIGDLDLNLDFSQIEQTAQSISVDQILQYIKYVKKIYKNDDGNLSIIINGNEVYGNEYAKDIVITLATEGGKISYIKAENIFFSNEMTEEYEFLITANEWTEFNEVNQNKKYIDISGSNELIKAFINMTTEKDFHIKGSLDIIGNLIGIDIKWNVPYDIQVKVIEKGKVELYACLGEIPAVIGVNNDVPYEFGDTESGSDRMLYLYYKDGYIYIYRSEYVDIMFGAGKRSYEKCTKVSLETFMANPMGYLQYCIGFTDSIMGAINTAMDKASNRTSPIDYSNIIKSFTVTNDTHFALEMNMAEIANNSDLDSLSLSIALSKDENSKNYISDLGFSIFMPLADAFKLTLSSSDTKLVNWGNEVDLANLNNYVGSYNYGEGEYWQASKGKWSLASETLYTINFVENGGSDVNNITSKPGSQITLPTFDNMIIDDGKTKTTRVFIGWFTTENFKNGSQFTSETMPSRDLTLYAKWSENVQYYKTLIFETNSSDSFSPITKLIGEEIVLPVLTEKEETEGNTTYYYEFAGWFSDEDFENQFNSKVMPSENTTLFAKWNLVKTETTALLNVYDNGTLIYSKSIKVGDKINLSSLSQVNDSTRYYLDSDYQVEYTDNFVMNENLSLHIRNKYTISVVSEYSQSQEISLYQGEKLTLPEQKSYVKDDGNTRETYQFVSYSENPTIMPNENKTITANWDVDVKRYFTIQFDLRWYIVFGTTAGCNWKNKPNEISSFKALEGTTLDLTQYAPTGIAYTTAIHTGKGSTFKATSWGLSAWSDYTHAGSGIKSYVISSEHASNGTITLYACWEKQ